MTQWFIEDSCPDELAPLCDLRATFQQRTGGLTTLERLTEQLGSAPSGFLCSDELRATMIASQTGLSHVTDEKASDHLPLIADYQVPAVLAWNWNPVSNLVLVGANISVDIEISNDAPVTIAIGADVLNVDIVASGDVSGSDSVSVPALSPSETV